MCSSANYCFFKARNSNNGKSLCGEDETGDREPISDEEYSAINQQIQYVENVIVTQY